MNSKEGLTIATHNIFCGGIAFKEYGGRGDIVDWLGIHHKMLIAKDEGFIEKRIKENPRNPIQELIDTHDPDILILNEILPDFHDKSIPTLKKNGYQTVIGRASHVDPPLTRAVVIGSKYPGEEIEFIIPGKAGSGSYGLAIPELSLSVLALHPSAFNRKIRNEQLIFTADKVKELQMENPDYQIIVAGDFNIDGKTLDTYFIGTDMKRHSIPTFPHSSLMLSLNAIRWRWLRDILHLQNGQIDLDHIFTPNSWRNIELATLQTTSDHLALILKKF